MMTNDQPVNPHGDDGEMVFARELAHEETGRIPKRMNYIGMAALVAGLAVFAFADELEDMTWYYVAAFTGVAIWLGMLVLGDMLRPTRQVARIGARGLIITEKSQLRKTIRECELAAFSGVTCVARDLERRDDFKSVAGFARALLHAFLHMWTVGVAGSKLKRREVYCLVLRGGDDGRQDMILLYDENRETILDAAAALSEELDLPIVDG